MEPRDEAPDDPGDEAVNPAIVLDDLPETSAQVVPASLDAFLAQIERRAFRVAELHLGHREDALDAVQDAMLRLVRHYRDKPSTEWTPLFWGILRRRIVDLQRRRKVRSVMVGWLGGGRDEDGGGGGHRVVSGVVGCFIPGLHRSTHRITRRARAG